VAHEENVHLNPSADAVKDWLKKWVKDSYSSKASCDAACSNVQNQSSTATNVFHTKLADTQRNGD
jgi:hypothetical protein